MYNAVKHGNNMAYNYKKFICDTVAEKDQIDVSKLAPGSTVLVIDTKEEYIMSSAKQWVLFTKLSDTIGGSTTGDYLDSDDIASLSDATDYLNI